MNRLIWIVFAILMTVACECVFAEDHPKPPPPSFRLAWCLDPTFLATVPNHKSTLPEIASEATYRSVALRMPWVYVEDRDGHLDTYKAEGKSIAEPVQAFKDSLSALVNVLRNRPTNFFRSETDTLRQLSFVSRIPHAGDGGDLKIVDDSLVLTQRGGLRVYSLTTPSRPGEISHVAADAKFSSLSLVIDETRAHVLGNGAIATYDISSPSKPVHLATQKNSLLNLAGCLHGNLLYVAQCPARAEGRTGIAVYDIHDRTRPAELAFVELKKTAYHLFVDDNHYLIACTDGRSGIHTTSSSNIRIDGNASLFELSDAGHPTPHSEIDNCGGRSATTLSFDKQTYLVCNGITFQSNKGQLNKRFSFYSDGSTLDGAPYHGSHDGRYAALATDHNIFVIETGDRQADCWRRQRNWMLLMTMFRLI